MDFIITSVTEQDPVSNEEALIDQDSDVFDTEITISPIFVSRRNMFDNVGRRIPFLEAVQATEKYSQVGAQSNIHRKRKSS
jgi:hypothetical protein